MTNQTDNFPDLMSDDSFEVVMRGYSRRQVHDYMIRSRNQIRDLEERLARTIDQAEQSRLELADARRKLTESPQNPDELGERLSQILKLAHEEAAANKEASQNDASKMRDQAAAEAERLVNAAREQAESIRTAAQEEAERRIHDATASAERLLSQAGAEAEEKVATASAEAEDTLRDARSEADRRVTAAKHEAERLVSDAQAVSTSTLTSAQRRATTLDEHTGRRVVYLTDTHTEVVRRLNEIGAVLGDLLQRESSAGPLIDEASVLPPAPSVEEDFKEDFSGEGFNDEGFNESEGQEGAGGPEDLAATNQVRQVAPAPQQAPELAVRPEPVQQVRALDGMPEDPRLRTPGHDDTPPFRA
jgi:cell division septum initiation protein DivIVA